MLFGSYYQRETPCIPATSKIPIHYPIHIPKIEVQTCWGALKQSQVDEHGCDDERCLPLKQTVIGFLAVDTNVHRLDKNRWINSCDRYFILFQKTSSRTTSKQTNKNRHAHGHVYTHAFVNKATNGQRDIKHEKGKQNLAECHCWRSQLKSFLPRQCFFFPLFVF